MPTGSALRVTAGRSAGRTGLPADAVLALGYAP